MSELFLCSEITPCPAGEWGFNGERRDEEFDVSKLCLVSISHKTDRRPLHIGRAVQRGRANPVFNWGRKAAEQICAAGNSESIPFEVWHIGEWALFTRDTWHRLSGYTENCALRVVRTELGFLMEYIGFIRYATTGSYFPSMCS